jgi:uncharacterized protein with ACT and thioredoxin-like domain
MKDQAAMLAHDTRHQGRVIFIGAGCQMAEIIVSSAGLDIALADRLNMEGERTNRMIHFRPSALKENP